MQLEDAIVHHALQEHPEDGNRPQRHHDRAHRRHRRAAVPREEDGREGAETRVPTLPLRRLVGLRQPALFRLSGLDSSISLLNHVAFIWQGFLAAPYRDCKGHCQGLAIICCQILLIFVFWTRERFIYYVSYAYAYINIY